MIDPTSSDGDGQKQHGRKLSHSGESLYVILGIERSATPDEIRKAYRKLALQLHPDKRPGDAGAAEMFKEVNRANSILSDPNKRSIYDMYGSMGIMLMDNLGEDNVRAYMALNHPCVKALVVCLFCFTGCCCCLCCCCCCNFCCGKCAPDDLDDEEGADIINKTEDQSENSTAPPNYSATESPITAQPTANGASSRGN